MSFVQITTDGAIAELVLDRPKVNAMHRPMLEEMLEGFRRLADDDGVHGVLVRGQGPCLSAGLDLHEVAGMTDDEVPGFIDLFEAAFTAPFTFPKPLAVAVEGHAIAGGLVLALAADHLVFGRGDYKVGLTELAVGVPFPRSAFEIVRAAMGPRALHALVHGADTYDPESAFALGVGDALVDEPVDEAMRWLRRATTRPLSTFRFVKTLHRGDAWQRIQARSAGERHAFMEALLSTRARASAVLGRP